MAKEKESSMLVTTRLDRRTKLAVMAAIIVAGIGDDPRDRDNVKEAVDGAFLIDAEIEGRIPR